jgi:hypothetical protein
MFINKDNDAVEKCAVIRTRNGAIDTTGMIDTESRDGMTFD